MACNSQWSKKKFINILLESHLNCPIDHKSSLWWQMLMPLVLELPSFAFCIVVMRCCSSKKNKVAIMIATQILGQAYACFFFF